MKLKRTSRRLVRRIALGLAVVAVAAPSAGGMYGLPMTGYNDTAVKTAALAHAYDVWKQNGGDQVTASAGTGYVSAPSGGSATGFSRPAPGVQDVTGSVGPSWVAPGLMVPADPAADEFRTAVSNLTESSSLRNYNLIPQYVLDEFGPSSRPAPGVRAFFGPIGQVSQPVPGGSGPIVPISRPESGALIPNDLSGRQFGPAALPTESTPLTAPESRFGPGRALPVASPGEEFTWDDATIGIVAGLGTALVAALAGIAVMGRRDRLARA
jgi:hypothetical protein